MPYLNLKTNVAITPEQSPQLLSELSRLMSQTTGKPERYVLVELTENKAMLFGGTNDPLAYLECKSIGLTSIQAKALSASISTVLKDNPHITSERIYIEFSNCPAEFWGWNGSTFA
jgi:phenylpyruvate tautomerase